MKSTLIIVLLTSILFGCKSEAPTENQNQGSGGMSLAFNKSEVPSDVALITATLSRDGYSSIIKNLNVLTDTSAEISIPEVLAGAWNLKIDAKDVNGTLLYTGATQVTVIAGQTVNISLTLQQVPQNQTGTINIFVTWANNSSTTFPKFYGGPGNDMGICILQTNDNGYLLGGINKSAGNGGDAWLIKVNAAGEQLWSKMYGGKGEDRIDDMVKTDDGGYLLAGYTVLNGEDSWIVKIDSLGNKIWEKNYGIAGNDAIWKIVKGLDGSYYFCGYITIAKEDSDGIVPILSENYDGLVTKISPNGNIMWSRSYGGSGNDFAMNLLPILENNLIIVGNNGSSPGKSYDFWIFRLDNLGNVVWEKNYGGTDDDRVGGIVGLRDTSFIISGYTTSSNQDAWIMRLDYSGNQLWAKTLGGPGRGYLNSLQKINDNNIIASGYLTSFRGSSQGWMVSIDGFGNSLWSKNYGGSANETINGHIITNNKIGFIGWSNGTKGGSNDFWLGVTDFNGDMN